MRAESAYIKALQMEVTRLSKQKKELIKENNQQLINFAKYVGDRALPEYSKSTDKWRWWDNDTRNYKYSTTKELLTDWIKTNK